MRKNPDTPADDQPQFRQDLRQCTFATDEVLREFLRAYLPDTISPARMDRMTLVQHFRAIIQNEG